MKTVLVVDDDPFIRRIARRMLEVDNWTVLEASDPIDAQTKQHACDIILSDWCMPLGGGQRMLDLAIKPVVIHSSAETELIDSTVTWLPKLPIHLSQILFGELMKYDER